MKRVCMIVQDKMVKGGIAAVISGYYGSELEEKYIMQYVEAYRDGNKLQKTLKAICAYGKFAKLLLTNAPDLVHIHSSFGPSFYRKMPFIYMAGWKKIPVVNHIHGADFDTFYVNASEKKKKQIRKVYGKCTRFIALSSEWKERLSQIVPKEKIAVVENYSVIKRESLQERISRACNHTVLFLGELGKRKGCFDIPAVAEKVVQQIPNVTFVMAGDGSEEDKAALHHEIQKKNLQQNFVFPGWVRGEKKDELLKQADLFFLPSYNEGMPMSILDAMGYALPVVSTNVGGIPKIVHDQQNGTCCEPGDTKTFSEGIVSILKDDALRKSYAEESMRIVLDRYSLESHLKAIEAVYEEVFAQ